MGAPRGGDAGGAAVVPAGLGATHVVVDKVAGEGPVALPVDLRVAAAGGVTAAAGGVAAAAGGPEPRTRFQVYQTFPF